MSIPPKVEYLLENPPNEKYKSYFHCTKQCMLSVLASTEGEVNVCNLSDASKSFTLRISQGYNRGVHVWQIIWPFLQRGKHAVVGVATNESDMDVITGFSSESWSWNLNKNKIYNDAFRVPSKNFPYDIHKDQYLNVPNKFYMVLDMDNGALGFIVDNTYVGEAFNLRNICKDLYFQLSIVSFRYAQIMIKHWHMDFDSPLPLVALCRGSLRKKYDNEQMEILLNETSLPKTLKKFIKYKNQLYKDRLESRVSFFKASKY